MIRPKPARWFEILAARDDAPRVLAALASTRAVELEPRSSRASVDPIAELLPLVAQFDDLDARYRAYWPQAREQRAVAFRSPIEILQQGLIELRAWSESAEPMVRRLQAIGRERAELVLWERILLGFGDGPVDFAQLGRAGPIVRKALYVFPAHAPVQIPAGVLVRGIDERSIDERGMRCVLVVGAEEALQALGRQCDAVHGHAYSAPSWLEGDASATLAHLPSRLQALESEEATLHAALDALNARHDLQSILGDVLRLHWVAQHVRTLETTDLFCFITGWTSDANGRALAHALERSGARALLHFPEAPAGREPPLLLRNPWWARPFEIFARALGMPSRNEVDPSAVLALAVPLMFGYMFGDVGQGLVLAGTAYVLRNRFAVARLLVAGGLFAAVFGVAFGSVFSLHWPHALWVHPLDHPLTVLAAPLFGGALFLFIGLCLGATEAYWRGELALWIETEAGVLLAYTCVLVSPWMPTALFGCIAGLALFSIGEGVHARSVAAGLAAIAGFVERMVQVLINTLSFARVGAFALAHAGLSSAIVALMDATDTWIVKGLVLVIGNLVVIALETMIVSIQTTRLVLFEFFTRFLAAEGRVFRPLPAPPEIRNFQET